MAATTHNYEVKVYQQHHRDFPPWVATATRTKDGKQMMFNVEGRAASEVSEKARQEIERRGW